MTWAIRVGKIGLLIGGVGLIGYYAAWIVAVIAGVIVGVLFLIAMAMAIGELVAGV